jgi:hypothetical protein
MNALWYVLIAPLVPWAIGFLGQWHGGRSLVPLVAV